MRQALNQYVPEPIYEDSMPSQSNPIREIEEYHSTYQDLPETEREMIVQSRIGQGRFRTEVINYWNGCAVTSCQRIELLRASHIKPWRNSSNEERLDVYNGLLLIPNLDVAFDNGMVSFAADGKIIISGLLTEDDRLKLGIHPDMRITRIDERHRKYLEYHRKNVFDKKAR
jgi:5-methylcytosine-specific restriction protein A